LWDDVWIFCFGEHGDEYQAKEKLALIPNMMYLPRVKTQTQFKSESLKPRESTIKETSKEMARNVLVVRQQTSEVGDGIQSRGILTKKRKSKLMYL